MLKKKNVKITLSDPHADEEKSKNFITKIVKNLKILRVNSTV